MTKTPFKQPLGAIGNAQHARATEGPCYPVLPKKFLVFLAQDLLSDPVFPELHGSLKATFILFGDCEVLGFIISWVGTPGWGREVGEARVHSEPCSAAP